VGRAISVIVQGESLRILDAKPFRVVYSTDNWETKLAVDSTSIGRPGSYVDIPTQPGQTGSIIFTMHWNDGDRWLGYNCEVAIHAEKPQQGTAADKPKA
jgi:glucoamylase